MPGQELDFFDILEKNKEALGFSDAKTDQERVDAVLNTPFFMNSLANDPESDPILSALQSMQFEGTKEEVAVNFKVQGNNCFKRRAFHDALKFYSQGIAAACDDKQLNSVLYCNRAAVNLELGNYRSVLNDCAAAIRLNQKNLKAYYRSAKALLFLERVDEGIDCCQLALKIDSTCADLKETLKKLEDKKKVLDEMALKRAEIDRKRQEQEAKLDALLKKRGYRLITDSKQPAIQHPLAPVSKIELDQDELVFPVLFLYPEFKQSDFISQFRETDTFYAHFEAMFGERAPWDTNGTYHSQTLEWYFESGPTLQSPTSLVSVLKKVDSKDAKGQSAAFRYVKLTLADVLRHPLYTVVNGVCTFIILVRNSEFASRFKQEYQSR